MNGLPAETSYSLIKSVASLRSGFISLIKLIPKTGRTHQLRIHCAGMGNPILGDKLYGESGNVLLHKGLFLVATELNFIHPILKTDVNIKFSCHQNLNYTYKKKIDGGINLEFFKSQSQIMGLPFRSVVNTSLI